MIELYLLRHGECFGHGSYIGRGSDVFLTDHGKKQIESTARFLNRQSVYPKHLLTSPMKRTVQSADIVSKELGLTYKQIPGIEESDFGLWEGLTYDQIAEKDVNRLERWIADPINKKPPGGESLLEVRKRVIRSLDFLEELVLDRESHEVLIISHRGPLAVLLLKYLELDLEKFWSFRMDRGSLTKINLYPRFAELVYLNFTAVP